MTIKEIEAELNVPRATVRFYEKENLIHPQRGENGYRDYSYDDVSRLKRIITLRKVGISVSDVEDILDGIKTMEEVVDLNITHLQEQIDELNGALKISKIICERNESIDTFDGDYYWNIVVEEEKNGNKFMDIAEDIVKFEKHVILEQFDLEDVMGGLRVNINQAILRVVCYCTLCGIVNMFLDKDWTLKSFTQGAFLPVKFIIIASIFGLPVYFIGKKHPEMAKNIKKTGIGIGVVITILLLILDIFF